MSLLVSFVLVKVFVSLKSVVEYVNSPERRKPAKAILHAALKFSSLIVLSPVWMTFSSVEKDIGSAFLVLSSG
jgi:hypothetical protein